MHAENRNDAAYIGSLSSTITTGYGPQRSELHGPAAHLDGRDVGIRHAF